MSASDVEAVIRHIDKNDLWDDRREYSLHDLEQAYQLNRHDTMTLYNYIQGEMDIQCGFIYQMVYKKTQLLKAMELASYDDFQSYTPEERVIIKSFLSATAREASTITE